MVNITCMQCGKTIPNVVTDIPSKIPSFCGTICKRDYWRGSAEPTDVKKTNITGLPPATTGQKMSDVKSPRTMLDPECLKDYSIRELKEFCMNSGEFHRVKHSDAFRVLVNRLEVAENKITELEEEAEDRSNEAKEEYD